MTERTARAITNTLLGAVSLAAGWYLFRTPRLRRVAWRLAKAAVTTAVPAYLARETTDAWRESARRSVP